MEMQEEPTALLRTMERKIIGYYYELLRCPAEAALVEASLLLADRCHSLRSLLPPPAALPSLPTSFATLSR